MLVIRESQKQALQKSLHPALVEKILRVLLRSDAARPPEQLRPLVETAVHRAAEVHGLRTESGIADYAGLAVQLGPTFDQDEAVASRLARTDEPPEARLRRIFVELTDEAHCSDCSRRR